MRLFKGLTADFLIVLIITFLFVTTAFSATAPVIQKVIVKGTTVSNNGSITLNDFVLGNKVRQRNGFNP